MWFTTRGVRGVTGTISTLSSSSPTGFTALLFTDFLVNAPTVDLRRRSAKENFLGSSNTSGANAIAMWGCSTNALPHAKDFRMPIGGWCASSEGSSSWSKPGGGCVCDVVW